MPTANESKTDRATLPLKRVKYQEELPHSTGTQMHLSKKVMVFSFLEFFRKGGHHLISSMAGMKRSLWISGQMFSVFE